VIGALLADLAAAGLVASEQGGAPVWLLLLGPVGAGVFYAGFWNYYRNTDESHAFERETRIAAKPITGHDVKVREVTGTRENRIDGDNHSDHRRRVQRVEM
jgi:hypothetical protein